MAELTMGSLEFVLRQFPLDSPTVTGRHEAGIINDNWLVADADGNRYFLRGYQRVREPERVRCQLKFQEHLRTHGFPTASVVPTHAGETFAMIEDTPWALFAFVDGDEFDFGRLPQAEEAGRRLAQFAATAAGYGGSDAPVTPGEVDFSNLLAPASSHMWRDSILADEHDVRLEALFPGDDFAADLAYYSDWRRRAATSWPPQRLAALERCWLHCDYHGRNMVFRGDQMTGLFDFDFVTTGPRTYDIARGTFNFGRESRGSRTLRDEFCRAFLDGYEAEAPLSPEERESLGFMGVLNWSPDAGFYAIRREDEGDEGIARRFRADVNMMRAIDGEMRRLAPAFGWGVI